MPHPLAPPFSRRDLDDALRFSGVGVFAWDIEAGTITWSDTLHELFGFNPGDFGGDLSAYQQCIHPDDRARVMQVVTQALERATEYTLTHRIVRRNDGQIRHVECRGGVLSSPQGRPLRMTGSVVDVTPRIESEERAREHEEITALLNELASDYVYIVDLTAPSLAPSAVAGSFARLTGYEPEEVAALGGWLQIVHPEDREALSRDLGAGLGPQPFISEYRIYTKAGDLRWLRDHVRPQLNASGDVVRLVGGVIDITEPRALEDRVRAAQRVEAVAQLAGTVAHDFNNLLTIIYGAAAQLVREDDARSAQAFSALTTATERAAELSRGLLAMGPRPARPPRPLELRTAMTEIEPLLRRAVGEASLSFALPDRPCRVFADSGQLQLVLLNLLINAAQASNQGNIQVRVQTRDLKPEDPARPPELNPGSYGLIEVSDDGPGIPADLLPQIFDPFVTSRPSGTGLGLAIARNIVHRHDGALTAQSSPGTGATFTVYLPSACASRTRPAKRGARITNGGTECVLLIEPDPWLREQTQRGLAALGYRVHAAPDPCLALELPWADLEQAALVLADETADPHPDSPLICALRKRDMVPPILTMTHPRGTQGGRHDPAAHTVAKPFTISGLARRIRDVLDAVQPNPLSGRP
ncbi:MAG: PAS domain-containing hybrid sensor histidine kinase/response regulator [Deltaproteobacteria bacterium]|nr:MAG: PAS domain-containing hybrid sensor histidine kinase/response regulator [Deltaproteobacteria bacterium]